MAEGVEGSTFGIERRGSFAVRRSTRFAAEAGGDRGPFRVEARAAPEAATRGLQGRDAERGAVISTLGGRGSAEATPGGPSGLEDGYAARHSPDPASSRGMFGARGPGAARWGPDGDLSQRLLDARIVNPTPGGSVMWHGIRAPLS